MATGLTARAPNSDIGIHEYNDWAPHVPVAERRRRAMRKMESLRKKGVDIQPVRIAGRKIARTF